MQITQTASALLDTMLAIIIFAVSSAALLSLSTHLSRLSSDFKELSADRFEIDALRCHFEDLNEHRLNCSDGSDSSQTGGLDVIVPW